MEYNLDFCERLIKAAKSLVENKSIENEASRIRVTGHKSTNLLNI